jgi:hypothetical protein
MLAYNNKLEGFKAQAQSPPSSGPQQQASKYQAYKLQGTSFTSSQASKLKSHKLQLQVHKLQRIKPTSPQASMV